MVAVLSFISIALSPFFLSVDPSFPSSSVIPADTSTSDIDTWLDDCSVYLTRLVALPVGFGRKGAQSCIYPMCLLLFSSHSVGGNDVSVFISFLKSVVSNLCPLSL